MDLWVLLLPLQAIAKLQMFKPGKEWAEERVLAKELRGWALVPTVPLCDFMAPGWVSLASSVKWQVAGNHCSLSYPNVDMQQLEKRKENKMKAPLFSKSELLA